MKAEKSEIRQRKNKPEMTAADVIGIVHLFNQHHLDFHIDGGWGVDALLGTQTRPHADLDIAVRHKDVAQIRALLAARGYEDVPRDDTRDCNFVLGDQQGHQIDIHSYTFDATGHHIYGVAYPLESLTGTGSVNGHAVKCISPEWMVKFHTGYQLDDNDYRDVKALCQRFDIKMPLEYEAFEMNDDKRLIVAMSVNEGENRADLGIERFASRLVLATIGPHGQAKGPNQTTVASRLDPQPQRDDPVSD